MVGRGGVQTDAYIRIMIDACNTKIVAPIWGQWYNMLLYIHI